MKEVCREEKAGSYTGIYSWEGNFLDGTNCTFS